MAGAIALSNGGDEEAGSKGRGVLPREVFLANLDDRIAMED